MKSVSRCLLVTAAVTIAANHVPAQQAAALTSSQSAPTAVLHTGTKLVVVDVVVTDKNGNPVHGLQRSDFVVSESHEAQQVRAFEEYSTTTAKPATFSKTPKLPEGMFTDYSPVPDSGPLNVLLIDALNTPLADQGYLRDQMINYVKHLQPGSRIAIFGSSDHLYMLHGFTSDPKELQAFFTQLKNGRSSPLLNEPGSTFSTTALTDSLTDPSGGAAVGSSSSALMSSDIATFLESIGAIQSQLRTQYSIEAFMQMGRWLLNFPGRKNLIWFSGAFPLGVIPGVSIQNNTDVPSESGTEFRTMTNLLTQARVAIYPVDPRGVQVNPAFQMDDTSLSQGSGAASRSSAFAASLASEHTTMQAMASDTGGEPFYNRNDLVKAVSDAVGNGANYYTLAYNPTNKKEDGAWRGIEIQLTSDAAARKLKLSYRRGYYADVATPHVANTGTVEVADADIAAGYTRTPYVRAAMIHGGPLPADLLFTARILPASTTTEDTIAHDNVLDPKNPANGPYRRYDVDVAVRPADVQFKVQPDGVRIGMIEILTVAYNDRGKLLNTATKTVRMKLTPEAYQRFLHEQAGFHMELSVPVKGNNFVRVGIEDVVASHLGAIEIPVAAVSRLSPPEYSSAGQSAGADSKPVQ
ncbi:MAG TPA: VWA domain-containing protein [Acidobacteriaceae bacterium]|jgi:VWFA-related protein